jgi:hypothetical protein
MEARRVKTGEAGLQRSRQPGSGGRLQIAPAVPGLHPCPRESGALSTQTEKGRLCRSEAKASRQSRDRLKRHPQEGQHSAAPWRDPGPSASGERHSIARGIEADRPRRLAARFTKARPAEPDAKRHSYHQFFNRSFRTDSFASRYSALIFSAPLQVAIRPVHDTIHRSGSLRYRKDSLAQSRGTEAFHSAFISGVMTARRSVTASEASGPTAY